MSKSRHFYCYNTHCRYFIEYSNHMSIVRTSILQMFQQKVCYLIGQLSVCFIVIDGICIKYSLVQTKFCCSIPSIVRRHYFIIIFMQKVSTIANKIWYLWNVKTIRILMVAFSQFTCKSFTLNHYGLKPPKTNFNHQYVL